MAGGEVPTMQECMDDHAEGLTSREEMIAQLEEMITGKKDEIITNPYIEIEMENAISIRDYSKENYGNLNFSSPEEMENALFQSLSRYTSIGGHPNDTTAQLFSQQGVTLPEDNAAKYDFPNYGEINNNIFEHGLGMTNSFDSHNALTQSLRTIKSDESGVHEELSRCLIDSQKEVSE